MSVTLVYAAPGSQQGVHVHPDSTQIYVVVAGTGRMIVGEEEVDVSAGTPFPARIEGTSWVPAD